MSYFWGDDPLGDDLERHRAEYHRLTAAIEQTDGKHDAMSIALNRAYRRMRYNLKVVLAQLEKGRE